MGVVLKDVEVLQNLWPGKIQVYNGLSAYEQFFVKEAFLRFKSNGAEMNCSDVYDVLFVQR